MRFAKSTPAARSGVAPVGIALRIASFMSSDDGSATRATSECLTVCEDAVRRMSFDAGEVRALSGSTTTPPRTSEDDGTRRSKSPRPPVAPKRATPLAGLSSALTTMLEAVSPKAGDDEDEVGRAMFGSGASGHARKRSSDASFESTTTSEGEGISALPSPGFVAARGLGGKSASLASFLPACSLSPPTVHRFTSALIEETSPQARSNFVVTPGSAENTETSTVMGKQTSTSAPEERSATAKYAGGFPQTFGDFKDQFVTAENPTPQSIPPPKYGDQGIIGEKHVLIMVGLPARGKTHMAKRLCQYLRFFHGANTRVFNVGEYRRRDAGVGQTADYFTKENEEQRMKFARAALKDMIDFLFQEDSMSFLEQRGVDSGRVAIFDATNSTRERRRWLIEQIGTLPLKVLFIESICTDEAVVEKNVRMAKINNCDYSGVMTEEQAFKDFMQRVRNYEKEYEPMGSDDEVDLSFIKLIDCGRRVEFNRVHGFLLGRVAQFLSNMHATTCSIYLSRHGQSEYNSHGKIGGDSGLTPMGEAYAQKLAEFADRVITRDPENGEARPVRLWTSSLQRTKLTARHLKHDKVKTGGGKDWIQMAPRVLRNLDEIYAGVCDGMTYEEIRAAYPREYELRRQNKLSYRYPRGESYLDVIARLDPLVQELESYREDVLIVGHQGVLRLIYAYFAGLDRDEAATLSIPLNTVIKLTPRTHDCIEERVLLHDPSENQEPIDPPSY